MKKLLLILIFLLPFTTQAYQFRALLPSGKTALCDQVANLKDGSYCYQYVKGKLKSLGKGTIQLWTGLYDPNHVKIYEGDHLSTPLLPNGILMLGSLIISDGTNYYYGWYIKGDNGGSFPFRDLSTEPTTLWSTVIK
jgi:hypothetical protein